MHPEFSIIGEKICIVHIKVQYPAITPERAYIPSHLGWVLHEVDECGQKDLDYFRGLLSHCQQLLDFHRLQRITHNSRFCKYVQLIQML